MKQASREGQIEVRTPGEAAELTVLTVATDDGLACLRDLLVLPELLLRCQ